MFVVGAVVMGMSHTIAKERIFAPLRKRAGGMETWRGYLISCPYCVSHWLAFLLVPLTDSFFFRPFLPAWGLVATVVDWFLSAVLLTVVAAFLRVIFYLVDESQGLARRRKVVQAEEVRFKQWQRHHATHPDEHPPH
jgi:hypothetical protein